METLTARTKGPVNTVQDGPGRNQPNEIPQPGKNPEADPALEPEPGSWPRKDPETQPGKEPLTVPPMAPPEIPRRAESTPGKTYAGKKITAKEIRSHYKACLDKVFECFSGEDNTATSAVHELRVNLKRVDALIRLIRFSNKNIPSRKLKAFYSFFRLAGKLRSAQIEFELISEYFSEPSFNPTYLHQLHENKARHTKKYLAYLKKGPSGALKKTLALLRQYAKALTRKDIRQYLEAEEKRIAKHLKRNIFREQEMHDTRKELKRYYLNLTMAQQHNKPVRELLNLLGLWHDLQVAFDHLIKAIHTAGLTEPENEPIQKIKGVLVADKENLYENIVSYCLTDVIAREKDSPALVGPLLGTPQSGGQAIS